MQEQLVSWERINYLKKYKILRVSKIVYDKDVSTDSFNNRNGAVS